MIDRHEHAVIQVSGGKDSLAVLYLLRPHWDKCTVMWVNTGAAYPETVALMERIRAEVPRFLEVRSDQPGNVEQNGWPVDLLPIQYGPQGRAFVQDGDDVRLQSFLDCCRENVWLPSYRAVLGTGATLVIRGQRKADKMRSPIESGHVDAFGLTYWFPIEDWSTDQVFQWMKQNGVPVPAHYAETETSLDCWSCTAYCHENLGRYRYTARNHREKWEELRARFRKINDVVAETLRPMNVATMYYRRAVGE